MKKPDHTPQMPRDTGLRSFVPDFFTNPICRQEKMKFLLFSCTAATVLLSACIGPPKIDFSKIESSCAQQCSTNHSNCMSGFKLFPLVAESQCNDAMETCAKTCPTKPAGGVASQPRAVTPQAPSVPTPTATERLKELDALFKGGLISKEDYESKKQEILKSI